MRKKAYAYLRVSSQNQIAGDGLPRQREAIARHAVANGIDIVAEYRDEGVSGTLDLDNRPGLAAMLAAAEADGVRIVLVERADRLSRDLIVGELILADLRKAGVSVWTAEGIDLTAADGDPTKRLIRQILGAVAEYGKTVLVLKLRAARDRMRQETGRCEGIKPYGSVPGEERVLARIRQLRRKPRGEPRRGYRLIAKMLQAEGYPTRSGRPWRASSVQSIVSRNRRLQRKNPSSAAGRMESPRSGRGIGGRATERSRPS